MICAENAIYSSFSRTSQPRHSRESGNPVSLGCGGVMRTNATGSPLSRGRRTGRAASLLSVIPAKVRARHSRESGNPASLRLRRSHAYERYWVPAFAGDDERVGAASLLSVIPAKDPSPSFPRKRESSVVAVAVESCVATPLGPRFRGDDERVEAASPNPSFPRKRESSVVGLRRSHAYERHWVAAFAGTTSALESRSTASAAHSRRRHAFVRQLLDRGLVLR